MLNSGDEKLAGVETIKFVKLNKTITSISELKVKIKNAPSIIGSRVPIRKKYQKYNADVPMMDLNLNYYWENTNPDEETVTFQLKNGKTQTINFIRMNVILEIGKQKKYDSNHRLLKKENRVESNEYKVIFFQFASQFYALIFSGDKLTYDRICKLIVEKSTEEDDFYNFDPALFTWLFYLKDRKESLVTDNLTIGDISGFVGTINNTDDSDSALLGEKFDKITGDSDSISDLFITKAFMVLGYQFTGVKVSLNMNFKELKNYSHLDMSFDKHGNSKIRLSTSFITTLFSNSDKSNSLALYVYTVLMPMIQDVYKKGKDVFLNKKDDYVRELAENVKKEIDKRVPGSKKK